MMAVYPYVILNDFIKGIMTKERNRFQERFSLIGFISLMTFIISSVLISNVYENTETLISNLLEIVAIISGVLALCLFAIRFALGFYENVKKREISEIIGKALLLIFLIGMIRVGYSEFSRAIYKFRIEYGTALIFSEITQNNLTFDSIPDSLAKDPSIKAVKKNLSLEIFQNEAGNIVYYFKPTSNSKSYYGIAIEENGDIHKHIKDTVSTYEDCLSDSATTNVRRILDSY